MKVASQLQHEVQFLAIKRQKITRAKFAFFSFSVQKYLSNIGYLTWTSWRRGPVWTSWGSTRPSARSYTWVGVIPDINTGRGMKGSRADLLRGTWGTDRRKAGREPAMWAGSPEGQPCAGLHQEKHGQKVERGDSAPLLCSGETQPGVLRSALEPSAQERHGTVGAGPKEGYKNDPRAGAPLL